MGANSSKSEASLAYESIEEDWSWVWAIRDAECLDWKQGLSDDEIQAQALRQNDLPVQITEHVYLGNARSVESIALLKALEITAVLNMAGPLALKRTVVKAYKENGISYHRITSEDEPFYPLLENHWKEAFDFIKSSTRKGKGKCVIHCMAGMNRSGLIAAAYYMITTQTPVLATVKHVRKQRGNVALCNEGFQQQLVAMARMNNLLGAEPGTEASIVKCCPPPYDFDVTFNVSLEDRVHPLDKLAS